MKREEIEKYISEYEFFTKVEGKEDTWELNDSKVFFFTKAAMNHLVSVVTFWENGAVIACPDYVGYLPYDEFTFIQGQKLTTKSGLVVATGAALQQ